MMGEHTVETGSIRAERHATRPAWRPPTRQPVGAASVLMLQSMAGNRAVRSLVATGRAAPSGRPRSVRPPLAQPDQVQPPSTQPQSVQPQSVQRCGPNSDCDCPPDEKARVEREAYAEDGVGPDVPVQRDRMAAAGFSQPLTPAEEFAASRRRDAAGNQVLNCWEPQTQDFRAAADGPSARIRFSAGSSTRSCAGGLPGRDCGADL